ncbi:MAG TPA: methyltransferase domain-containing protein [Syntrophorhabdaceae bacterium]|nr:methyltransferase domain-containing protein [Syntrophorhabdaceae bacterium]
MTNDEFLRSRIKQPPVERAAFFSSRCRGKKVLDLGCIQHTSRWAVNDPNWLHKKLYESAGYVLGIDSLEADAVELKRLGFNIIYGDVTKPLHLSEKFDVIIAGNLIEHLSNFEGFFRNVHDWLAPDGEVLISTANPFYMDQYFYSAFRNSIVINPEHTCWLDPVALKQLAERFLFRTTEIYFVKDSWKLGFLIPEGKGQVYDMFDGTWKRTGPYRFGLIRKIFRKYIVFLFRGYCKATSRFNFDRYGEQNWADKLERRIVTKTFSLFWNIYKLFIVRSDLNRYELYISVLKRQEALAEK